VEFFQNPLFSRLKSIPLDKQLQFFPQKCLSSGVLKMRLQKPKLEWQLDKNRKAGGRWYIVHNRKPKFFNGGNGKSDREGYKRAQKLAEKFLEEQGEGISREELEERKKDNPSPPSQAPLTYVEQVILEQRGVSQEEQAIIHSIKNTISQSSEKWLKTLERQAKLGTIKPASYKIYKERLKVFLDFAGEKKTNELEKNLLLDFQDFLQDEIIAEKMTSRWGYNVLSVAKRFTKFLYQTSVLANLPRCFDAARISPDNPDVVVWEKNEITTFLNNAAERTQLFILLQLNCGFYPADISELKQSEVDWNQGTITRKRTKTEKRKTVPLVTYLLWDRTFELLKKFRSDNPTFALTNSNGTQLVRREFQGEKVSYVNNVAKSYERTCKKMKWKEGRKQLMLLRKTGSDTLKNHPVYCNYRQYYLGQAGETLADRRYTADGFDDFSKSQIWLGEQFGFLTER